MNRALVAGFAFWLLAPALVGQDCPQRRNADAPTSQRGRGRGPQGKFRTDVPEHAVDVILGRPTSASVTVSILSYADAKATVAYGTSKEDLSLRTDVQECKKGQPKEIVLTKLKAGTQYYYQLRDEAGKPLAGAEWTGAFHTQRPPGSEFVFTVQADSHLDENTSTDLYRRTLANSLTDQPDFHIDLGDTFMTDKHASRESAATEYLAQRYYLGLIGQAAPVFLILGNHDGEDSKLLPGGADSLAVWSNTMRKRYFPNPLADDFYTGNSIKDPLAGLLQDYYSWEWGDAVFIVLDPYWHSSGKRAGDCWGLSLGKDQYDWLAKALSSGKAKYKFVFIHQLVGGVDKQGRGGVEAAPFGEWGGRNSDGSDGFKEHRPGWAMPIHQLLVSNHVAIVFHGHDHLFARQELDGIVYQEVPQPGFHRVGGPRSTADYGYVAGDILGGSGHLRVTINSQKAEVQFVQAFLPNDENETSINRHVLHTYQVAAYKRP